MHQQCVLFNLKQVLTAMNQSNGIVRKIAAIATSLVFLLFACQPSKNQDFHQIAQESTDEQLISMEVLKNSFSPNKFTLRRGVPVKWTINVKELDDCNKSIVIPAYDLTIELQPGVQIIEFTPHESGVMPWSCWMGMISGTFVIVDNNLTP